MTNPQNGTPYGINRVVNLQIHDPKVGIKSSIGMLDAEGEHTISCIGCGKELRFKCNLFNSKLLAAACGVECAEKFVWPKYAVETPVEIEETDIDIKDIEDTNTELDSDDSDRDDNPPDKPDKPKICPICGGPAKGRGYTHKPVNGAPCSQSTEAMLVAKSVGRKVSTCPVCGGPAKGRGYTHKEVNGGLCPESTQAKLAAAKVSV